MVTPRPGSQPPLLGTHGSVSSSVLIVDDAQTLRAIAASTLDADDRWTVVGRTRSAQAGAALAAELQPDVVLIDLEMPWAKGPGGIPELFMSSPSSTIVLWTSQPESGRASAAIQLGAHGTVHKTAERVDHLPTDLALIVGSTR